MRFILGLILVFAAIVCVVANLNSLTDGPPARLAGQLTGTVLLSLIFGITGIRMMRRRGPR
jgi:hypothetical protein